MKPPESEGSDELLFPGAHSQVRGAHREESASGSSSAVASPRDILPLEAIRDRTERGWVVRLRVRAEHVTVSKEVVNSERVELRRVIVGDVARVEAVVQREELRLETEGRVEVVGSADQDIVEARTEGPDTTT